MGCRQEKQKLAIVDCFFVGNYERVKIVTHRRGFYAMLLVVRGEAKATKRAHVCVRRAFRQPVFYPSICSLRLKSEKQTLKERVYKNVSFLILDRELTSLLMCRLYRMFGRRISIFILSPLTKAKRR